MIAEVRKLIVSRETVHGEHDRKVAEPRHKVIAAAIIANPLAGRYEEDLAVLYRLGAEVAALLVEAAMEALPDGVVASAYGKGAIVGVAGEIEHAAALIHPTFGAPVRAALGGGKSIIPSTKKVGGPGSVLLMPLVHRDDIWSFDEMDAAEITVPDAPQSHEVLVALALAAGGRPFKRVTLPKA